MRAGDTDRGSLGRGRTLGLWGHRRAAVPTLDCSPYVSTSENVTRDVSSLFRPRRVGVLLHETRNIPAASGHRSLAALRAEAATVTSSPPPHRRHRHRIVTSPIATTPSPPPPYCHHLRHHHCHRRRRHLQGHHHIYVGSSKPVPVVSWCSGTFSMTQGNRQSEVVASPGRMSNESCYFARPSASRSPLF